MILICIDNKISYHILLIKKWLSINSLFSNRNRITLRLIVFCTSHDFYLLASFSQNIFSQIPSKPLNSKTKHSEFNALQQSLGQVEGKNFLRILPRATSSLPENSACTWRFFCKHSKNALIRAKKEENTPIHRAYFPLAIAKIRQNNFSSKPSCCEI